jgi:REP element-mobilizing transposase RayT
MSHTYSNLLFHVVWSTKDRIPFIKNEVKPRLHSYMRTVIEREGAKLLFINGVEDHVHLLLAMPLTMLIPDLIEKVKPVSTKWFIKTFPEMKEFGWQIGYGAFSVGKSNLQAVINYIQNQEEHHKKMTFDEEFANMLKVQGIQYDKRYFLN